MQPKFTIIYAYRNRDSKRVKASLASLQSQKEINFKVLFIDYGSTLNYSESIKKDIKDFGFVDYYYVGHSGLLWNKSKALNYGIAKANTDTIFIADVDVLFAPEFSKKIEGLLVIDQFYLFKIGYLPQSITTENIENTVFTNLQPKHYGDTFGVGLFPKKALEEVGGLDEFFHFYGSEDEELNSRLVIAGYKMQRFKENVLLHLWHKRYPQKSEKKLTKTPRLYNVQRINQRHFLRSKESQISILDDSKNRKYYTELDYEKLKSPSKTIKIDNIEAHVVHFLNFELLCLQNEIVELIINQSSFYNSIKYKVKTLLSKQTQPYLSMKQVNDLILQKIIFDYKDYNYAYVISEDLKRITFTIDLKTSYE